MKIERNGVNMTVLATPKKSAYIVKKDCTEKIIESKMSKNYIKNVRERANAFRINNLNK